MTTDDDFPQAATASFHPEEQLAALLDEVHGALAWFIKFPDPEAADAATLYTAVTHAASRLQFAPRLRPKSPQKRCGKTRLLEIMSNLVHQPLKTSNVSAAALVRSIGDDPPTIVFDEADAVFGKGLKGDEKAENLRGILNAGFDRNSPYLRWDVTIREIEHCPTFALAIIAGIGTLPDTIEDRSVPLSMIRKTKAETCRCQGEHTGCGLVHKYRPRRDEPVLHDLRDRLSATVGALADRIGDAEPSMPEALNDRAEDVWEALVAVADLAGGTWPARARRAAVLLSDEADDEEMSLGLLLLSDLREVFSLRDAEGEPERDGQGNRVYREAIATAEVIPALVKLEESPWHKINKGNTAIDANNLARLVKPFGVRPKLFKIDKTPTRGYRSVDLREAWDRYLPDPVPVTGSGAVTTRYPVTSAGQPRNGSEQVTPPTRYPLPDQEADQERNRLTGGNGPPARRDTGTRQEPPSEPDPTTDRDDLGWLRSIPVHEQMLRLAQDELPQDNQDNGE